MPGFFFFFLNLPPHTWDSAGWESALDKMKEWQKSVPGRGTFSKLNWYQTLVG